MYFDYYSTAQQAGFASTHQPNGDINESLSTMWYHTTIESTTLPRIPTRGSRGFHLIFNQFDTGNETTGFRLPVIRSSISSIILTDDSCWIPDTGKICFDTFDFGGLAR